MADIARIFQYLEKRLEVTLVLHDRAGVFKRESLPSSLGYHRHPYCRGDRFNKDGYDRQCMEHCFRLVNEQAARTAEPFVHLCWKKAQEVVMPLYLHQIHVATLFAGVFRAPVRKGSKVAGGGAGWHALPELTDQRREELCDLLRLAGQGLIALVQTPETVQPQGRKEIALRFLRLNAHRSPCLDELAVALSLSPSRTSHLMRELFDCGFQQLLTRIRLERACEQLQNTEYTIERIALGLGFQSAGYLHRLFLREFGKTPGEYRQEASVRRAHMPFAGGA